MGKRMIINGADFSANAIGKVETVWYTDQKSLSGLKDANYYAGVANDGINFYAYALNFAKVGLSSIYGKPINRIKLMNLNDPSEKVNNLKSSGTHLSVFKIRLSTPFDSLPQVNQSWAANGSSGTVTKVSDIPNSSVLFDGEFECVLSLTESVTLENENEFISVGYENGPGSSDYKVYLPYCSVEIPSGASTDTPAIVVASQSMNRGFWRSASVPAIDFGYEGL